MIWMCGRLILDCKDSRLVTASDGRRQIGSTRGGSGSGTARNDLVPCAGPEGADQPSRMSLKPAFEPSLAELKHAPLCFVTGRIPQLTWRASLDYVVAKKKIGPRVSHDSEKGPAVLRRRFPSGVQAIWRLPV